MKHGFDVDGNIAHLDNKSSILLENNGQASSGNYTWHINIC